MTRPTIMAVGAHIGDMELTAGGVCATYSLRGYEPVFVSLTAGEKGNPPHLSVSDYKNQKLEEAEKFAKKLGGHSVVLSYADGELPVNEEVKFELARIIRKFRPEIIITHHAHSIHKDHEAAHLIVKDAQFYAGLVGFDLGLPAHYPKGPYYAENWEDKQGFNPYVYFEVTPQGYELWLEAIECHWFVTGSTSFNYKRYYEALKITRGAEARKLYAECFDIDAAQKRVIKTEL